MRKYGFLSILLTGILALSGGTAAFAQEETQPENVNLQILATSDVHGWFVPWDFSEDVPSTRGALTYLATVIEGCRAENPDLILVDCGDTIQANYVEYFIDHDSNPMMDAFNYLGVEVWTFGNHEYNFDLAQRQAVLDQYKGVALSGNVFYKNTGERYLPATTVVERNGVKVGFVGMTTPLIVEFEQGKNTLDEVEVRNPMDCIGDALAELEQAGADVIIGLIHEGLEEENNVYGSGTKDIAEAFPQFDVIISGHAHVAVESETVGDVLLCEPYYYGRNISLIDLSLVKGEDGWDVAEKSTVLLPAGSEEEEGLLELMTPYKEELSAYVNTPIGQLVGASLAKEDPVPGIGPATMGTVPVLNLMSTAASYYSGADCMILNPTYERPGFDIGDISIKNISSSYQFTGGEVSVYPVTGKEVKAILEYCGGYFNTFREGDLTISYNPERRESKYSTLFLAGGLSYTIDVTQEVGNRVQNLALIQKDEDGNPLFDEEGNLLTTPIEEDTPIQMGAHDYYIRQWTSEGGCLEGLSLTPTYSSSTEFGDDGTVRNLTIRYIKEYLNGTVDGTLYAYENWSVSAPIDTESEDYQKMIAQLSDGTISLPSSESGRTNIASLTAADLK